MVQIGGYIIPKMRKLTLKPIFSYFQYFAFELQKEFFVKKL